MEDITTWLTGMEIAVDIFEAVFMFVWLDRFLERRYESVIPYRVMVIFLCVVVVLIERVFQTIALGMVALSVTALLWCVIIYRNKISLKIFLICLFYAIIAATEFLTYGFMLIIVTTPAILQEANYYRLAGMLISKLLAFYGIMFAFQVFGASAKKQYSLTYPQWLALSGIAILSIAIVVLVFHYNNYLPAGTQETGLGVLAALGIVFINCAVFYLFHSMQRQSIAQNDLELQLQQHDLLRKHYANLERIIKTVRQFWHDTGNHYRILHELIRKDKAEETDLAEGYLKNLISTLSASIPPVNSGHPVIDAVLAPKYLEAQSKEIVIDAKAATPFNLHVSDVDLGTLLSNILDNAIEAAEKIPEPAERYIKIKIELDRNYLIIIVVNSMYQPPRIHNGAYLSDKPDSGAVTGINQHGLGLAICENITAKYHGSLVTEVRKNEFRLIASLEAQ